MVWPKNYSSADELLAAFSLHQEHMVKELARVPGADALLSDLPNATMFAMRIPAEGGEVAVPTNSTPAPRIRVPKSALRGLSTAAAVATLFHEPVLASLAGQAVLPDGNIDTWQVFAGMDVQLWDVATGEQLSIADLTEPIEVSMPVEESHRFECAYWETNTTGWISDGLVSTPSENLLTCSTTHLSFFAAILKGFLDTLQCTQLELFSKEAMQEILAGDWYGTPVAVCFWVLEAAFLALMLGACFLDRKRKTRTGWSDEAFLLVPLPGDEPPPEAAAEEEEAPAEQEEARKHWFWGCPLVACCVACCATCASSSELRDVVDEIVSNWFENFGEIRDCFETIWENMQMDFCGGGEPLGSRLLAAFHAAMGSLMARAVRGQVSASVWMSEDVVDYVLNDEDVKEVLQRGKAGEAQYVVWHELHQHVLRGVESHWHSSGRWCMMPVATSKLFVATMPCTSLFLGNPFASSSVRVLLFICDVIGSVTMATFFFQASGAMKGKKSKPACDGEGGLAESIGRLIAIGLVSWLVAGVPTRILESLSTRELKEVDCQGGPKWKKQLRIWRLQDMFLWSFGLLYASFCTLFVVTFLANVAPMDQGDWGVSGAVSLAQDTLLNPLAAAVAVPLFANSALHCLSCIKSVPKVEIMNTRRSEQGRQGNWSHEATHGEASQDMLSAAGVLWI